MMPEKDQNIRIFLAVPIDEAARKVLAESQSAMQRLGVNVQWVAPQNLHLTLVFLGEIPGTALAAVREAIAGALSGHAPCSLAIHGLGYFGTPAKPRTIWAGLQGDLRPLTELQSALVSALQAKGFRPDTRKPFNPHLTLGRARGHGASHALANWVRGQAATVFGRLEIRRLLLVQSHLTPHGPLYNTLEEHLLDGSK